VPIAERGEALPPLDVTGEDETQAFKLPIDLQPKDPGDIGAWWVQIMTWMGAARVCRERQLREALSTLSATQRELEELGLKMKGWKEALDAYTAARDNLRSELSTTQRERDELKEQVQHFRLNSVSLTSFSELIEETKTQRARVAELEKALKEEINQRYDVAYEDGFIRCRELSEHIVDEHDGYLNRIGSLDPTTSRPSLK
jgi:hypothetical protein